MRSLITLILSITAFLALAAFMFISCGGGGTTTANPEQAGIVAGVNDTATPTGSTMDTGSQTAGDGVSDPAPESDASARLERMRERIEAAVEAGEMTREEADAKLSHMGEWMGRDRGHGSDTDARWERIQEHIEAAVDAGEMTREEADAKYEAIRERMANHGDKKDWNLENIQERIEAAVEAGEMTREEADAKLSRMREWMGQERGDWAGHHGGKRDCGGDGNWDSADCPHVEGSDWTGHHGSDGDWDSADCPHGEGSDWADCHGSDGDWAGHHGADRDCGGDAECDHDGECDAAGGCGSDRDCEADGTCGSGHGDRDHGNDGHRGRGH